MEEHPIERFDPLLRNMLAWNLVDESTDGTWTLRPDVNERLTRLAQLTRRPETSAVVYFGHVCAACRTSGATRRYEGRYLCDACGRGLEQPGPEPAAATTGRRRLGSRHRERGLAS